MMICWPAISRREWIADGFPSLAKSEYVNGPPERFAAMILKGNAGQ